MDAKDIAELGRAIAREIITAYESRTSLFVQTLEKCHQQLEECRQMLIAMRQERSAAKHKATDEETVGDTYRQLSRIRQERCEELEQLNRELIEREKALAAENIRLRQELARSQSE